MFKRGFVLVLAVLMLATCLIGCDGSGDPANTTNPATTPVETTGSDVAPSTSDPANTTEPAPTYGGYELTIAASDSDLFPKYTETGEFASAKDEAWGDELAELEERLDVTISHQQFDDEIEALMSAGMSGDKIADVLYLNQKTYWPARTVLLPVDGDELKAAGLDCYDEERWFQPAVEWSKLEGKAWGLNVASEYVLETCGFFVCFNKDLTASAGYDAETLYQLVRDKKWTWDLYLEIAHKTTKDTDGDGVNDIWGTGATGWGSEIISNDMQYIGEVDGKWQLTIGSDEGITALQHLYDFNYGHGTRWDEGSGVCRQGFADGMITFNFADNGHIKPGSPIYASEHDYGILPMPLNFEGGSYASGTDNNPCLVFQNANKDLDKVVPILNEWALIVNDTENWKDIFTDGRCRTDADLEMMTEYIIPNFVLNVAKMSDDIWDLVDEGIISGVSYNGLTPQQAIEQYEDKINAALDAFFGS